MRVAKMLALPTLGLASLPGLPVSSPAIEVALVKQPTSMPTAQSGSRRECATYADLRGLCSAVFESARSADPRYRFEYQNIIARASCTGSADDATATRNLVQKLWKERQDAFVCNSTDFEIPNGNVLKYAFSTGSMFILNDAIARWQLDLNIIDRADGRTILDYLDWLIGQIGNPERLSELREYRDRLVEAGARTASQVRAGSAS